MTGECSAWFPRLRVALAIGAVAMVGVGPVTAIASPPTSPIVIRGESSLVVEASRTTSLSRDALAPTAGHFLGVIVPSSRIGWVAINRSEAGPLPLILPLGGFENQIRLLVHHEYTLDVSADGVGRIQLPASVRVVRRWRANHDGKVEIADLTHSPGAAAAVGWEDNRIVHRGMSVVATSVWWKSNTIVGSRGADACFSEQPISTCLAHPGDGEWGEDDVFIDEHGFDGDRYLNGRIYNQSQLASFIAGHAEVPGTSPFTSALLVGFAMNP